MQNSLLGGKENVKSKKRATEPTKYSTIEARCLLLLRPYRLVGGASERPERHPEYAPILRLSLGSCLRLTGRLFSVRLVLDPESFFAAVIRHIKIAFYHEERLVDEKGTWNAP